MLKNKLKDVFSKPDPKVLGQELIAELRKNPPSLRAVTELLRRGASLEEKDAKGVTALMCAVFLTDAEIPGSVRLGTPDDNHYDIIREVLKYNPPVNAQTDLGHTALMMVAETGSAWVTKALLDQGADPTITDNKQRTALYYAENNRQKKIAPYTGFYEDYMQRFESLETLLKEATAGKVLEKEQGLAAKAAQLEEKGQNNTPPKSGAPFR